MKHFISMTSTLAAWLGGTIKLADLQSGAFYFDCSPEHLEGGHDPTGRRVPHEATWANTQLPCVYADLDLGLRGGPWEFGWEPNPSIYQVDEANQDKVRLFLDLVAEADKRGCVRWKVGNYPTLLENLAYIVHHDVNDGQEKLLCEPAGQVLPSHPVWAFGHWTDFQTIRVDSLGWSN